VSGGKPAHIATTPIVFHGRFRKWAAPVRSGIPRTSAAQQRTE
jgi:hypothetical protein